MDNNQDPKPQPSNDPEADSTEAAPAPPTRSRVFRLRALIAATAAGVVLGAAGGATVTALVDGDHDRSGHSYQHGEQGERPPGMPPGGQLPGGTVPEDGSDSDAPAAPGDTSTS